MRRRQERSPFAVGAVVLAVIAVFAFLTATKDIPFVNEPYTIQAAFRDSSGIANGSPVRIAGVQVGKVSSVRHTSPGSRSAVVTMAIDDDGRPVHRDAEAKIRPRIFLEGNFFVDLQPGAPGTPELDDEATIPVEQTASPVQLDQVLKTLKSDVRTNLRMTFAELFNTYQSKGGLALNRSLRYQPAAYRYTSIVSEALLGERPGDLGDLIRDQGVVSAALDQSPRKLIGLVVDLNDTAAALADRQNELRSAVRELPRTLQVALPTLASLNAAFPAVRRFAQDAVDPIVSIGPSARELTPLVAQLRGLVAGDELRGLAGDLRRATPPAARLARGSVGLLAQLRALASCTDSVLVPYGNDTIQDKAFPATGRVFEEIPKSLVGLAGESRSNDANGQFFKILGTGGPEIVTLGSGLMGTSAAPMRGVNPPPQRKRPPLRPDVPCETQEPPDLRTDPAAPPGTVRADPSSPATVRRGRLAQRTAIDALQRTLRTTGSKLKVLQRSATRAEVAAAAARRGRGP